MNVVSHDPNFHESRVGTASDLREHAPGELGQLPMNEWQPPQGCPREHAVESNGHKKHGGVFVLRSRNQIIARRIMWTRPERARSAPECVLTGRTQARARALSPGSRTQCRAQLSARGP